MNIKEITRIVNLDIPDPVKEKELYYLLAKDPEVVPMILTLLARERQQSRELLLDANLELSKAAVTLSVQNVRNRNKMIPGILAGIKEHYHKWQKTIKVCFNMEGFPGYEGLEDDEKK